MRQNVGTADRVIRIMVAAAFFILWLTGVASGTLAIVLCVVGFVFLLTAIAGRCPLYLPFGISTRGRESSAAA